MPNQLEMVFSEEFSRYRQEEMGAAAELIDDMMGGRVSSEEVRGALKMLKKCIMLPYDNYAKTEETKKRVRAIINRDIKRFQGHLVRIYLKEEERE